jgi:hypothetical protein
MIVNYDPKTFKVQATGANALSVQGLLRSAYFIGPMAIATVTSLGILVVTLTIYTGLRIILSSVPKVLNLLGILLSKCPRFTSKLKIFGAHTYLASVDANSLVPIGVMPIRTRFP